ncbi:hypothetical protein TVAG_019130 [Trichomonas vaginalis G3]|uniref:Cilia- and flagella-associated protein 418 n=1 Tax=Trichomonas vaginalis (strain ATCC PRA-98 / G3) TaxID=412133 RepID=A2DWY6_TRIV3|nr:photoreceptor cell morphogenesis protein family [Trichomonas vaginalis G3]EAY15013.1 hypothetical protein TVAG_019130 [Trichomonas vaginalis G3]KAI5549554.1 photoreceptor cell morphogenesis protein family [Trichomonas vaginalis G3]|eukprot:XP_001327236.1 hypothetical protein [Trichomonas vaginalis G3]
MEEEDLNEFLKDIENDEIVVKRHKPKRSPNKNKSKNVNLVDSIKDQVSDGGINLDSEDMNFIEELIHSTDLDKENITDENKEGQFQIDSYNHVGLSPSPRSPVKSTDASKHCADIFIGPPSLLPGITISPLEPHFCKNLQCINCDHIVLRFPDRKWASNVDYLFLRNNYPNKVDSRLVPSPGFCAFCCQCTFKDTDKLERLGHFDSDWVCRGH